MQKKELNTDNLVVWGKPFGSWWNIKPLLSVLRTRGPPTAGQALSLGERRTLGLIGPLDSHSDHCLENSSVLSS